MRVVVHPIVLLTAADQYTRQFGSNLATCGLLFGKRTTASDGSIVLELLEVVEISLTQQSFQLKHDDISTEIQLFQQCYSDHVCLGWCATGDRLEQWHTAVHRELSRHFDSKSEHLFVLIRENNAMSDDQALWIDPSASIMNVFTFSASNSFERTQSVTISSDAVRHFFPSI